MTDKPHTVECCRGGGSDCWCWIEYEPEPNKWPGALETAKERSDDLLKQMSPDGCCHKTRIKGGSCPVGWKCPYIKEDQACQM